MTEMTIEKHAKPKCPRNQLGNAARVWWALWRCSRDKWLSPEDVLRIGDVYAACISSNPRRLVLYALNTMKNTEHCLEVGMLAGESALQYEDKRYQEFAAFLKQKAKPGDPSKELKLLQLFLKGKHCGR